MATFRDMLTAGWDNQQKDLESQRRIKELAQIRADELKLTTAANQAAEQRAYQLAHDRFVNAHINANRDLPGVEQVGLADNAERDWARDFAKKGMAGVKDYLATTATIPGAGKEATEKQRADTNTSTVTAEKAEGATPFAATAGAETTKADIAKAAANKEADTTKAISSIVNRNANVKADTAKTEKDFTDANLSNVRNNALLQTAAEYAMRDQEANTFGNEIRNDLAGAQIGLTSANTRLAGTHNDLLAGQQRIAQAGEPLAISAGEEELRAKQAMAKWKKENPEVANKMYAPMPYFANPNFNANSLFGGGAGTTARPTEEAKKPARFSSFGD